MMRMKWFPGLEIMCKFTYKCVDISKGDEYVRFPRDNSPPLTSIKACVLSEVIW